MNNFPLVSCLCVSHNSLLKVKRVVNSFKGQTYPHKELLILYKAGNNYLKEYSKTINDSEIIFIEAPESPELTLGQLRNMSISVCSGEYFCVWDDDDWYSSKRLEVQMAAIIENCKPVSMLLYLLMFDSTTNAAYLSPCRLWEGSLMCRKSIIQEECNYPNLPKGEDTVLLEKLVRLNYVFPIIKPNLYIYVFHGNNTWGYKHFDYYYSNGVKLSEKASHLIKDVLDEKYAVEESTSLLNEKDFLKEIHFRYKLLDDLFLQMA